MPHSERRSRSKESSHRHKDHSKKSSHHYKSYDRKENHHEEQRGDKSRKSSVSHAFTSPRHTKAKHSPKKRHSHSHKKHKHDSSPEANIPANGKDEASCIEELLKSKLINFGDIPKRLLLMSIDQLEKLQEEKNNRKALRKAMETSEEKRARRLAKKEKKELWRRERMGWGKEYMGYTNDDNPFGDSHLSETFLWKRKLDSEGLSHLSRNEIQEAQRKRMEENKVELESVRRRRLEREREKEEREKETELLQREKEAEYYRTWGQQEDNFHLEQAKLRSRIRIADGRAKPIDLLSKYIGDRDEESLDLTSGDISNAIDILEPTQFLVGLTIEDLEDLREDVKVSARLSAVKFADLLRQA